MHEDTLPQEKFAESLESMENKKTHGSRFFLYITTRLNHCILKCSHESRCLAPRVFLATFSVKLRFGDWTDCFRFSRLCNTEDLHFFLLNKSEKDG